MSREYERQEAVRMAGDASSNSSSRQDEPYINEIVPVNSRSGRRPPSEEPRQGRWGLPFNILSLPSTVVSLEPFRYYFAPDRPLSIARGCITLRSVSAVRVLVRLGTSFPGTEPVLKRSIGLKPTLSTRLRPKLEGPRETLDEQRLNLFAVGMTRHSSYALGRHIRSFLVAYYWPLLFLSFPYEFCCFRFFLWCTCFHLRLSYAQSVSMKWYPFDNSYQDAIPTLSDFLIII